MSTKTLQILGSFGNEIYTQNDEPVNAADGSLWVDLNEYNVSSNDTTIKIDSELSTTSANPVQNKVITEALNGKLDNYDNLNSKDDSGYISPDRYMNTEFPCNHQHDATGILRLKPAKLTLGRIAELLLKTHEYTEINDNIINKLLNLDKELSELAATDISLVDANNNFEAENVEDVLQEIATTLADLSAIDHDSIVKMNIKQTATATANNGLLANISENMIMSISVSQGWVDMPVPRNSVFIHQRYGSNYSIQTVYPMDITPDDAYPVNLSNIVYTRIVNHTDHTVLVDWGFDNAIKMQTKQSLLSSKYNKLLANIAENVIFSCSSSQWTDMPTTAGGVFINQRYGTNYNLQKFIEVSSGVEWNRIIKRTDNSVYRGWKDTNGNVPLKILALGDSICYGVRNSNKGFVGDLGFPYKNIGVSSASISNVVTTVTNIPDQLVNLKTSEPDYAPDIIIGEGGINDWSKGAPLGTMSTIPVLTDAEAEALDRSTVIGGLEYLLYKMISLYPKSQRFFLITHKTWKTNANAYCPTTQNSAGWTQQDLHDAIVECCNAYNVKVIDIYNDSMMNTIFSQYRSTVAYNDDNSVTNSQYCDLDGVHPLAYGYKECYVPIVRKVIGIGTAK